MFFKLLAKMGLYKNNTTEEVSSVVQGCC